VKILTVDEFPDGWEADNVILINQGFGSSWDPRTLRRYRRDRRYPRFADYVGLGAFEDDRLVGYLEVVRFPFRTPEEETTCSGIRHMVTAPDRTHQGLARHLLQEAHRREQEFGSPFSLLYTRRSGGAHRLYESLGYRDVLDFPWATRAVPRGRTRLPRGYLWRPARPSDQRAIILLHRASVADSPGFTRRGVRWWPVTSGDSPHDGWGVLRRDGRTVGYARVGTAYAIRNCWEAVAEGPATADALVKAIELETRGTWLVFVGSPTRAFRSILRSSGYRESPTSHNALMGLSLRPSVVPEQVRSALGADSPSFACADCDDF